MVGSRKWKTWGGRFKAKVESTSGMFALAGAGAAIVGALVEAPVAVAIGGAVLLLSVAFTAYASIPPKLLNPAQLLGKKLSLDQLEMLDRPLTRLVVVGASQSGKSTFLSKVRHLSTSSSRTNTVQAEIFMLPGDPPQYVALLDADGKEFVQQFEILRDADFLILFVDHSVSSTDSLKSLERLADHDRFIGQVEPVIRRDKSLSRVHLLLNKRDLWGGGPEEAALISWFNNHVADWKRTKIADEFSFSLHSNKDTHDMADMMDVIRQFVFSRAAQ